MPQKRFLFARPEGLEPPTLGSEDRCSIQLSYGRFTFKIKDKGPKKNDNSQQSAVYFLITAKSFCLSSLILLLSARGGTRTLTPIRVLDPKSSASANSATRANINMLCLNTFYHFLILDTSLSALLPFLIYTIQHRLI